MADDRLDIRKLLVLRKLTRAVADLLRGQLVEHLATLGPLLRPKTVLGEFIGPATKETIPGAEKTFKEIQAQYAALAAAKLYGFSPELNAPLSIMNTTLELTPVEYSHSATAGSESKTLAVVRPLEWVVSFGGFSPKRIRELLAARNRAGDDLQQCILHALMLHSVFTRQTGVTRILEALHFPVQTVRRPEFGDLPLTSIASIATLRPPDEVVIESTELSGMNVFEEVVNIDNITGLRDPLGERLLELVKTQAPSLLPPAAATAEPASAAAP